MLRTLRTILTIGLFAILGLFVLRFFFGIFGVLFAMLGGLLIFAIRIAIIGFIIYVVIRIVSPDTARKLRNWDDPAA